MVALAVVTGLVAVDRFFLWMERRGWIYWRRRRPDPRGAVLGPIDNVFNPAHAHVVEQQDSEERLADIQADAAPRTPASRRSDDGGAHPPRRPEQHLRRRG